MTPRLAILIAFAACVQQTANANLSHVVTMKEAAEVISSQELAIKDSVNARLFWSKVDKEGPLPDQTNPHYKGLGKCWTWKAGKSGDGYGAFSVKRKPHNAARIAFFLAAGHLPTLACHKCDNPVCVNPDHIFNGSTLDNIADKLKKGRGRGAVGERNFSALYPERVLKGEQHPGAILTENDVREIRRVYATGSVYQRDLGKRYGLKQSSISCIITRKLWKHI